MSADAVKTPVAETVGDLVVIPLAHPQGCRSYLVADPSSGQALALDPHLDLVEEITTRVRAEMWTLPYVVDSHTHADHPSGAGRLAEAFSSTRIAHPSAGHAGVTRHPADGEVLHLGDVAVTVRHAPGHTPDHVVLIADGALFSGDTLLIGGVARTDFLGGDAGQLFDSLQAVLEGLPDETVLYPGHDYAGRTSSTLGRERQGNPWLSLRDRDDFVRRLTANPPPRPANMEDLLRLNREGVEIPATLSAADAVALVGAGGAGSVVDVRTAMEVDAESVPGARHVPVDEIVARADEIRATPAPRLLLCRTGARARAAREALVRQGLGGLAVVEGGLEAYRQAGGETRRGRARVSLERQVRIAAGLLVLVGTGLGVVAHPAFLALAAFAGAGLVFAGLTDRCGMALLLARMPWNRVEPTPPPAAAAGGCSAAPPAPGGCAAPPPTA